MLRPRLIAVARPFAHRVRYYSAPPPPPPAPKDLSFPEQLKADIRDAQTRGLLKPPKEGSGAVASFLFTSIELLKFYLRGSKLIWTRQKLIKELSPPKDRVDYRFIHTQRQDVKKVVPFLFMALILEELIPIMILYVPSLLPSTCILPAQSARIRARKVEAAAAAQRVLSASGKETDVRLGSSIYSRQLCYLYGLPGWGPSLLQTWRTERHLAFVARDDKFLKPEDITKMKEIELDEALIERGLIVPFAETKKENKQEILGWWAAETAEVPSANAPHHIVRTALKFSAFAH